MTCGAIMQTIIRQATSDRLPLQLGINLMLCACTPQVFLSQRTKAHPDSAVSTINLTGLLYLVTVFMDVLDYPLLDNILP